MQFDVDAEISKVSKRFRSHDPQLWDHFVALLDHRTAKVTVAVTDAPADQILVHQGRAQEARKFYRLWTELPEDDPVQPNPAP